MSQTIERETLIRMIEATIEASRIPLTAGAILRLIETSSGAKAGISRTTIQRILDKKAEAGEFEIEIREIEKNGFLREARHYKRKGKA